MPFYSMIVSAAGKGDSPPPKLRAVLAKLSHPVLHAGSLAEARERLEAEERVARRPLCIVCGSDLDNLAHAGRQLSRAAPLAPLVFVETDAALPAELASPIARLGRHFSILDRDHQSDPDALRRDCDAALRRYRFRSTASDLGRQLARHPQSRLPTLHRYTNSVPFQSHIVEHSRDAIIAMTADGVVVNWNTAAESLFGHRSAAAIGHPISALIDDRLARRILAVADWLLESGKTEFGSMIELDGADSARGYFDLGFSVILDDTLPSPGILIALRDLSQRMNSRADFRQVYGKLVKWSFRDPLTGIANRRRFDQTLKREWISSRQSQKPVSLIMIDIDFFKAYNDFYGHVQGDACLRAVARALGAAIPAGGGLLARYGGEEFAILAADTGTEQALALARACVDRVAARAIEQRKSKIAKEVTITAGVATCVPDERTGPVTLIEAADRAMYRGKHAGRNRVAGD